MFVGPIPPPNDLDVSKRHRDKQVAWRQWFLARRRLSPPQHQARRPQLPGAPLQGGRAQWAKKAWDQIYDKVVVSSWGKSGLLLPLDGSGDHAWAKKALNSDAQGNSVDADAGEEEAEPAAVVQNLPALFDISDDNDLSLIHI